jgi:hypothetical protein
LATPEYNICQSKKCPDDLDKSRELEYCTFSGLRVSDRKPPYLRKEVVNIFTGQLLSYMTAEPSTSLCVMLI